jgi:hypothetical protein
LQRRALGHAKQLATTLARFSNLGLPLAIAPVKYRNSPTNRLPHDPKKVMRLRLV